MENKNIPLAERIIIGEEVDGHILEPVFLLKDVREAVRRLIDKTDDFERGYITKDKIKEIFGSQLTDNSQQNPTQSNRSICDGLGTSPADTFSKEDSEDTCICGHHTKDHSYDPNKLDADLECDICDCKGFRTKEDRSFLGGYAELWDNPEDNRWDKEEEKQDEK